MTKVRESGQKAVVELQREEEEHHHHHEFREENPLIEDVGHPQRAAEHDHHHKRTEDAEGKGHSVDDGGGHTVELLGDVETGEARADHLHEELPLLQQVDRQVHKHQEGEVYERVHYFDEGHPPYNLVDRLSQFLAAELQAAASPTHYHLIYHPLSNQNIDNRNQH